MLKTFIVDDDSPSIKIIERFLSTYKDVEIDGMFTNPVEALHKIVELAPQLVFLDIRMGELDGMKVAEKIREIRPETDIIFTTAYDSYAIKAFELDAADYLVKPIMKDRFDKSMERVLKKHAQDDAPNGLHINCFGKFRIYRHGEDPVKWRTEKSKELAALLIYNRGRVVTRDEIIELLWPDTEPERAVRYLHNSIYYIRKYLESYHINASDIKITGSYAIMIAETVDNDFEQYNKLYSEPDKNLSELEELFGLLSQDFMEGEDWDWAAVERETLAKRGIETAVKLGKLYYASKEYAKAETVMHQAYQKNPYDEYIASVLLKFYISSGQKVKALKFYETYDRMIREELDVTPGKHIRDMIAAIS